MTAHPCIIQQRAASIDDPAAMFEIIFAKRLEWLASYVEPHHPAIAELAISWATEHRLMAATLRGERQIGEVA